jgi:hypothetical protein
MNNSLKLVGRLLTLIKFRVSKVPSFVLNLEVTGKKILFLLELGLYSPSK